MSIALTKLKEYDTELTAIKHVLGLLEWDQQTIMPKKGISARSLQTSILSKRYHEMITSSEFVQTINALSKKTVFESLKPLEKDTVKRYKYIVDRRTKIPTSQVVEFSKLASESQHVWEIAKKTNDYNLFKPYLKRIIEMKRKEAEYIDPKAHPYEVLLDEYEEGMKVTRLQEEFTKLALGLKELDKKIRRSKKKEDTKKYKKVLDNVKVPIDELKIINHEIAKKILSDEQRFNLFESEHPFTATAGEDDVRITTSYKNMLFSIGATIHESGHALYELSYDKKLAGTVLADAPSLGMHESQSRYWENHVGTSSGFWKKNYSLIKKYLGEMTLNQFYLGMNHSEPSLIRVESDEVNYPMHVIIRFEIELGLIEGKLNVNDLPEVWNKKYEELLGIKPKNDTVGVLQDVHWSSGYFGYFPTYAIGTMYSAMIDSEMRKQIQNYDLLIEKNDFRLIREWLKKNIQGYGCRMKAEEIVKKATKRGLESDSLLKYLNEKYSKIYGF